MSKQKKYNTYWIKDNKAFAGEHKALTIYDERNQKFYQSKEWQRLQALHKQENQLCVECLKHGKLTAVECTDHILGLNQDWSLRLDYNNLQSLCISCHIKKEIADRKRIRDEKKKEMSKIVMNDLSDFS